MSANMDRVTFKVSKQARTDLDWLTEEMEINQTDVLNRAVRLLAVYRETVRNGGQFLRRRDSGETETILFL
jgi:hypothetical protein